MSTDWGINRHQNVTWDPISTRLTDLLVRDHILRTVRLARESCQTHVGIFSFQDDSIILLDDIYNEPNPDFPSEEASILANAIHERNIEDVMTRADGTALVGHPLWLHYEAVPEWKSSIKGCLILTAQGDPESLRKGQMLAKLVADLVSDRISGSFSARVHRTNCEALAKELNQGSSHLASIIDNIGAELMLIDRSFRIVWHNAGVVQRTKRNAVGEKCFSAFYNENSVCDGCLVEKTFATGEPASGTFTVNHPQHGIQYFQIITTPVFDENGYVSQVLELINDITDARTTETAMATYKQLIDNSEDFVTITDEEGAILMVNRKALNELGYTEEEVLGKNGIDFIPEQDRNKVWASIERAMKSGIAVDIAHLRKRDGSLITVEAVVSYDPERRQIATVGRDISERLRLEKAVQRHASKLQEQNKQVLAAIEEKNRFFRSISHELRTPLSSIVGFTEILLEDTDEPLSQSQKSHMRKVLTNSHKLLEMVNELLDLSRIEANRITLNMSCISLGETLNRIVDNLTPLAREKRLSIGLNVPEQLPTVKTDEHKLGQIVENLLSNAIKFTPEGKVEISVRKNGKAVYISVADTGIGIPNDDLPHLFKEFYRGSAGYSKIRGTGLGLAISQRLASLLGGNITVESLEGIGSRFTLELPVDPACAIERHSDENAQQLEFSV